MFKGRKQKQTDDLDIKHLPNEEGVEVNGKWYYSLENYFQKREQELKDDSQ